MSHILQLFVGRNRIYYELYFSSTFFIFWKLARNLFNALQLFNPYIWQLEPAANCRDRLHAGIVINANK